SKDYADEYQRVVELNYPPNDYVVASLHNSLGSFYQLFSDYETALYHRHKSLDIHYRIHRQSGSHHGLGIAYNNLGALYYSVKEYSLAAEYLKKAKQMLEIAYGGLGEDMIGSLLMLARAQQSLGLIDEAEEILTRAYTLQEKQVALNISGLAYLDFFAAQIYQKQCNYAKAAGLYQKSLEGYGKTGEEKSYYAL